MRPVRQTGQGIGALGHLDIHGVEDDLRHLMGIGAVAFAHLLHGLGEQTLAIEDVGVFGKEAEDQSRHEMVHVGASPLQL